MSVAVPVQKELLMWKSLNRGDREMRSRNVHAVQIASASGGIAPPTAPSHRRWELRRISGPGLAQALVCMPSAVSVRITRMKMSIVLMNYETSTVCRVVRNGEYN